MGIVQLVLIWNNYSLERAPLQPLPVSKISQYWVPAKNPSWVLEIPRKGRDRTGAPFCHGALGCSHPVCDVLPLFLTLLCHGNPHIQDCTALSIGGALLIVCHYLIPSVGHCNPHIPPSKSQWIPVFPLCLLYSPSSTYTMCLDVFAGSRGLWNISAISGLFVWVFFRISLNYKEFCAWQIRQLQLR